MRLSAALITGPIQRPEFSVGLDGATACDQTAKAWHPLVQDLSPQAMADPGVTSPGTAGLRCRC